MQEVLPICRIAYVPYTQLTTTASKGSKVLAFGHAAGNARQAGVPRNMEGGVGNEKGLGFYDPCALGCTARGKYRVGMLVGLVSASISEEVI